MRPDTIRQIATSLLFLVGLAPGALAGEKDAPAGRLIIALEQEHRVAAYSPQGELLASAPTGLQPRSVALAAGRILVTNRGLDAAPGSSLTLLSANDLRPLETISACSGCAPAGLHLDEAGRVVVGAQRHKAIQIFESVGGAPLRTLLTPWGWPGEIVPLPWGKGIAIGFRDSTRIGVLEFDAKRVQSLEVGVDPSELAPRPGYAELWVGTRMGRLAIVVPDASASARVDEVLVVEHALDLAFEPDGKRLFGASARSENVWIIDAETREPAGSIPLGTSIAHLLAFSPGGRYLAVALYHEDRCLIYDLGGQGEPSLVESFALTSRPRAIVWVP
jgi:DNA-binding beta-propeller fold protein YncE